jgi:hypothetical protein
VNPVAKRLLIAFLAPLRKNHLQAEKPIFVPRGPTEFLTKDFLSRQELPPDDMMRSDQETVQEIWEEAITLSIVSIVGGVRTKLLTPML